MQEILPAHLQLFRDQLTRFVVFTDEEWRIFAAHLYFKKLKKKDHFVTAGAVCSEIAFMGYGATRFFFVKDGIEISNYFCFERDLITSYGSFLKRTPSLLTIEALEETALICFSCDGLHQMLEDERMILKLERMGHLIAEYLICCYEDRVHSFLIMSPEERYQHLLHTAPGLLQRIPQHHIANYLGITPVSLSRIRGRIAAGGAAKRSTSPA